MALCGMTAPHSTTTAHFVSTLRDDIAQVFAAVLAVCDAQGLIGREMFAIDGVKLPSNASKHRSGTRAECTQRAEKLETAAKTMLERHSETDALDIEPDIAAKTTADSRIGDVSGVRLLTRGRPHPSSVGSAARGPTSETAARHVLAKKVGNTNGRMTLPYSLCRLVPAQQVGDLLDEARAIRRGDLRDGINQQMA